MTVSIGIDIGTSAVKAVLIGDGQQLLAEFSVALESSRPQRGWSEQDPETWWQATRMALAALRSAAPTSFAAARAIGLSGQMHALVALDRHDHPVYPAILWNDARAQAQCAALTATVPDIGDIAGVIAMPGFTAPKLLWLRQHEPEAYARIARIVLPKDFVRLRLSGDAVTDMADAAGTLWLDQQARQWSAVLLAASGADPGWMPRLVEGNAVSGTLRPAQAAELGLSPDTILAGGAGDAAAGGIGIGFIGTGDAYLSLGTSAQLFVTTGDYRPAPATLVHAFAHGLPQRWLQMAAMLNGASPLRIIASCLGRTDIDALLDEAAVSLATAGEAGPSRLQFLPYLAGERTPHNDADARGVLFGMDGDSTATDIIQAVLEGVAFSIADARQCLADAGTPIAEIGVVGGGARSALWMRIMADVLGIPVTRYRGSDKGPAFGAARLALMAATGAEPSSVATKPAVRDRFEASATAHARYAEAHDRFQRLYRALKPEFARASRAAQSQSTLVVRKR